MELLKKFSIASLIVINIGLLFVNITGRNLGLNVIEFLFKPLAVISLSPLIFV